MISFKRYNKSIKRDLFCFDFRSNFLVSVSFLINIRKEMFLPGFHRDVYPACLSCGMGLVSGMDGCVTWYWSVIIHLFGHLSLSLSLSLSLTHYRFIRL